MEGIHIALSAEKLTEFWGIPITNTMLTAWIVSLGLLAGAFIIGRGVALVPGKVQFVFESIVSVALSYMENVLEDKKLARRFLPLLATIFLFIFFCNVVEFTPGIGAIGWFHYVGDRMEFTPLFRSVNTDLNVTIALATISVIVIEVTGAAVIGFFKYWRQFFNVSSPMGFIVGVLELISKISRFIAFAFRLFGNIFSGEVLIMVVGALVFPLLVPVPLMVFEILVGFIQAAIFALLTLFFIKLAITEPEH